MNDEPKTLTEFQVAYNALKAENTALKARLAQVHENYTKSQNQVAELEGLIQHLKAKKRPAENESHPGITRPNFGGG